jgi:phosphoenolpyruvate-protein phosphotransferase (PTS system enzyme I)
LKGTGVAPGIGYGVAYRVEPKHPTFFRIRISSDEVPAELERFHSAVERARDQYQRDKETLEERLGSDHSHIIEAHLLMLEDRGLVEEVERRIRVHLDSSEKAVRHVADQLLSAYESLDDQFFKERGFDFREVIERLVNNLIPLAPEQEAQPTEDLILVGSELGLGVLARFPLESVRGLVVGKSGDTSHLAIVARSLQIPVVSGLGGLREHIATGDYLAIDGESGIVEVGASPELLERAKERATILAASAPIPVDREPCITLDGERVYLLANAEFSREVEPAVQLGAEGIGLFRSEYVYMMQRGGARPGEDAETELFRSICSTMGHRPVVVRTLDLAERNGGGFFAGEEVAALGLRGIRLSLRKPEVFRPQVRAIVRARQYGDLRIVLPMVTSADEVVQGRALIREVEEELGVSASRAIPVGVLVEVPAAVFTLESIAPHCDFLAVGTNDLIQYTLAAGRLNEEIAYLYNPLHPAVLHSLQRIVQVGEDLGLPVTVCGEMAAHPLHASVLIGLGYRRLSMTALAIPRVKQRLRQVSAGKLAAQVSELIGLRSLEDIQAFVKEHLAADLEPLATELPSR